MDPLVKDKDKQESNLMYSWGQKGSLISQNDSKATEQTHRFNPNKVGKDKYWDDKLQKEDKNASSASGFSTNLMKLKDLMASDVKR